MEEETAPRRRLPRTRYVSASPETWSLIRGAYLSGLSAPAVAARFGVSVTAIRKRAGREGWTKRDLAARATPWMAPAVAPAGAAPQVGADGAVTEEQVLDRWRAPVQVHPVDLARKALAGAAHALKAGEGLNALRLARAASEIARLDAVLEYAAADVARDEEAAAGQDDIFRMFMREQALNLAGILIDGRELPPAYQDLKAELARLQAVREADAAAQAAREAG
jgi:hypothetical protein